jgi:hypothetical protein
MKRYDLKPWPSGVYSQYLAVAKRQDVILAMAEVSLREGAEEQNKEVIRRMVPLILTRAREIIECCKQIAELLPEDRKGRYPRWYTVTLDIQARAMNIADRANEIVKKNLQRNEIVYIGSVLRVILAETNEIKALLEANPYKPGLEIWEDVLKEAFGEKS